MKLKIISSFDGNLELISEGQTLAEAFEDALNQLGYQSYLVKEE